MPWDKDNPPAVAKNWTADEQAKCVAAANAVLKETGEDRQAIFACIRAAGRSEKEVSEKRMNILDKVLNWLEGGKWGEDPDFVPVILMPKEPISAGLKVAEVDGKTMWFAYTTNAFEDREGEVFSTKALEDYVASVDSGEIPDGILAELKARDLPTTPQGELWLMHLPHTRIGEPLWKAVEGRFLLEAGLFDDSPMAHAVATHLKAHGADYGLSHGYLYNPGDREDGVYDWMHKFETSLLPVGWAANAWTAFSVIDQKEVNMVDAKKRDELVKLAGGDEALVDGFLKTASERTAALETEGVKHKGDPPPAPPPAAPPPADEPVAEVAPVAEPPTVVVVNNSTSAPVPEAVVEDKAAAAILQLAAEVKAMDTKMSSAFDVLQTRIAKLEADGQTISTVSRKDWLRPSQASGNVIAPELAKELAPVGTVEHILDTKTRKRA